MNTSALYHRPESEFAYLYDPETMHVRLRTARGDVREMGLLYGDPYFLDKEEWFRKPLQMIKTLSTDLYDYWFVEVTAPLKRLSYAFALKGHDGISVFYGDHGVYPLEEDYLRMPNNYFRMPFFHEVDRYKTPEWVKKNSLVSDFPGTFCQWGSEQRSGRHAGLGFGRSKPRELLRRRPAGGHRSP